MHSTGVSVQPVKDLVKRYRVCWDVWADYVYVKGEKRHTGFILELSGTHEKGVDHYEIGCEHCLHVYRALRTIAEYILPKETRPSRYEVSIFDSAVHFTRKRENRAEICLKIKVVHHSGFEQPVDRCQVRCLTEMEAALKAVGAYEGDWRPMPAKQDSRPASSSPQER